MKTFQAYIKSYQPAWGNVPKRLSEWKDETKYAAAEEAQKVVDKMTEALTRGGYEILEKKVVEGEQENTLVMEGIVGDNGCQYEDYALTLSDEKGQEYSRLIESEIGKNYKGRRVRITVELLD